MAEGQDILDPSRPWVAYIGPLCDPPLTAGCTRVRGISTALMHAGFNVIILGDHPGQIGTGESVLAHHTTGTAVRYRPVTGRNFRSPWQLARLANLYLRAGLGALDYLTKSHGVPSAVIHYGDRLVSACRVSKWCRRHKVPVIADVVEHMEGWQFPLGGLASPFHLDHVLYRRTLRSRFDGLICISDWLRTKYSAAGVPIALVRTTLDTDSMEFRRGGRVCRYETTLGYAGSSGNGTKDLLRIVIEAVLRCRAGGLKINLNLAGVSPEEVRALLPRGLHAVEGIHGLGWVPRDQALAVLRGSDFMPLLRRDSMYAWAGFPTKVAESLASGTPVIANPVGDVKHIVSDGHNGLISALPTVGSFKSTVERAASLSEQSLSQMRQSARATAVSKFDYCSASKVLSEFLPQVVSAARSKG